MTATEKVWKNTFYSAESYYDFDYYDYYDDEGDYEAIHALNIRELIEKHHLSDEEIKRQIIKENNEKQREPDYDLIAYHANNTDEVYTLDDIQTVLAEIPGHNDEDNWHWILELKDHTYVYTTAWCDYTGWDCQSGGSSFKGNHINQILESVEELDIKQELANQIIGYSPIGTQYIKKYQEE